MRPAMGIKNDLSALVSETVSLYRSIELYELQGYQNCFLHADCLGSMHGS